MVYSEYTGFMETKQLKVSVKCWEVLRKLAKKQKRTMGKTVEVLVEEATK